MPHANHIGELRHTIDSLYRELEDILSTVLVTRDMFYSWTTSVTPLIYEDLIRYVSTDPAAHGLQCLVEKTYFAFRAVAIYRIAHEILTDEVIDGEIKDYIPRYMSEYAKTRYGLEIHPAAAIGRRFVVDHGFNTVIGETCIVGDDVTILNNVVLGSLKSSGNPQGARHPIIGNRVTIAGNVKIFGPVRIGDDVIIDAGVIVARRNISPGTHVSLVTMIQVERGSAREPTSIRLYGLVPEADSTFSIHGRGLENAEVMLQICSWPSKSAPHGACMNCEASLVTVAAGASDSGWRIKVLSASDRLIQVQIDCADMPEHASLPCSNGDATNVSQVISCDVERNARLIISCPDGRRLELESEELSQVVAYNL